MVAVVMGNVELLDPTCEPKWDEFVVGHPLATIHHLSAWKWVLETSFQHMRGYYLVLLHEKGRSIQAALPLFMVNSRLTGRRFVSIPFATLSDPLISTNEDFITLFDSAVKLSEDLAVPRIEIGAFGSSSLIHDKRLGFSRFYKHHYLLLNSDPEQLKRRFHRTCVRQRISRALRSNLGLRVAGGEADLKTFYKLYLMTRKRLGLLAQPYAFFRSLWDAFRRTDQITLLLAEKKGTAIAGLILLKFKPRVSAEVAVSDYDYRDVSPNHFLFWESIKLAYNEGFRTFDFGRTSPNNPYLMEFKGRWGTEVVDLPRFHYPKETCKGPGRWESSLKYKLVRAMCRRCPEFALEKFGEFGYRHLG